MIVLKQVRVLWSYRLINYEVQYEFILLLEKIEVFMILIV